MNTFWTILNDTSQSLCFNFTLLYSQNLVLKTTSQIWDLTRTQQGHRCFTWHQLRQLEAWRLKQSKRLTLTSLVVEAVSLNISWDWGQNAYMLPVHVAAWLPYKMIAGFQAKSSQRREGRQVKGVWLFMLSPKSGNVTSARSIHQMCD